VSKLAMPLPNFVLTWEECISPSVMLPENRLAVLLEQVKQSQIDTCLYHTQALSPSLYSDHFCDRRWFPTEVALDLTDMNDEIWQVQFSHDGSKLAACGSSRQVIIWDTHTFSVTQVLDGHDEGVGNLSFSPDDSMILCCARDGYARLWSTSVSNPWIVQLGIMLTQNPGWASDKAV
jgi:WD40 repeat protein